jgi:hypothetical protein
MSALGPAIDVFVDCIKGKMWMAGLPVAGSWHAVARKIDKN